MSNPPFWKVKSLKEMTPEEWESLCDGCGKCCLVQLEDEEGDRVLTSLSCKLYDGASGKCRDYGNRSVRVPDCVRLTPDNVGQLAWMPKTCAYRLIHEGRDLPDWHPLVTGDPQSTFKANMSVRGQVTSEMRVDDADYEDFIREWPGESGDR
ncbi:YcgN family cysteine cluster protein [Hyphobacterium sp.]|uniref:YcgN family cysteine cluster protein n=1 Tax=Hyphobacterium sp. TaxID=2004662 RepID=UPI003747E547